MPEEAPRLCWYELGPPELGLACAEAARLSDQEVAVRIEGHALIEEDVKRSLSLAKYIIFLFKTDDPNVAEYAADERGWEALRQKVRAELDAGAVLVQLTTSVSFEDGGVELLRRVAEQGHAMMQQFEVPDSMPSPEA